METDWAVRVAALQRLEAAAGAAAARGAGAAFVQRLCAPELRDAVAQQSTDQRSSVVRALAATLAGLAGALGDALEPFADALCEPLMRLLVTTNRVMFDAGERAVNALLAGARVSARGLRAFTDVALHGRHAPQKQVAVNSLARVLAQHARYSPAVLEQHADTLALAVRTAIQDSSPLVRSSARAAYRQLHALWPDRAAALAAALDPKHRKYLVSDGSDGGIAGGAGGSLNSTALKRAAALNATMTLSGIPRPKNARLDATLSRSTTTAAMAASLQRRPFPQQQHFLQQSLQHQQQQHQKARPSQIPQVPLFAHPEPVAVAQKPLFAAPARPLSSSSMATTTTTTAVVSIPDPIPMTAAEQIAQALEQLGSGEEEACAAAYGTVLGMLERRAPEIVPHVPALLPHLEAHVAGGSERTSLAALRVLARVVAQHKAYLYFAMGDVLPPLLHRFTLGGSAALRAATDQVLEELLNAIDADVLVPALTRVLAQPDAACHVPALILIKNTLQHTPQHFAAARNTRDVLAALAPHLASPDPCVRSCAAQLTASLYAACRLAVLTSVDTLEPAHVDALAALLPALRADLAARRPPAAPSPLFVQPPVAATSPSDASASDASAPLHTTPIASESGGVDGESNNSNNSVHEVVETPSAATTTEQKEQEEWKEDEDPLERLMRIISRLPDEGAEKTLVRAAEACEARLADTTEGVVSQEAVEALVARVCECSAAAEDAETAAVLARVLVRCIAHGVGDACARRVHATQARLAAAYAAVSHSLPVVRALDALRTLATELRRDPARFLSLLLDSLPKEGDGKEGNQSSEGDSSNNGGEGSDSEKTVETLRALSAFCQACDTPETLEPHADRIVAALAPLLASADDDVRRESVVCVAECAVVLGEERAAPVLARLPDLQQRAVAYYVSRGQRRNASQRDPSSSSSSSSSSFRTASSSSARE